MLGANREVGSFSSVLSLTQTLSPTLTPRCLKKPYWGGRGEIGRSPPLPPRLARNAVIETTFDVGRRFRCTIRVDCGQIDPGAVIRPAIGEWHPHTPERLDEEALADWRA